MPRAQGIPYNSMVGLTLDTVILSSIRGVDRLSHCTTWSTDTKAACVFHTVAYGKILTSLPIRNRHLHGLSIAVMVQEALFICYVDM